ncbi:MAG: VCBS repeat-containing protein [Deltaproteobacteria bacterium]|nr:VCBS repeat-containing protein [Deltaproteobacteria bacterium]
MKKTQWIFTILLMGIPFTFTSLGIDKPTVAAEPAAAEPAGPFEKAWAVLTKLKSDLDPWIDAASYAKKLIEKFYGVPTEIELARDEIIAEIKNTQITRLEGTIIGMLNNFADVVRDPNNMHNSFQLNLIKSQADLVLGEMQSLIERRDSVSVKELAVASNLATAVGAAARKLLGMESAISPLLQRQMDMNYSVVGVDSYYVNRSAVRDSAGSSLLWSVIDTPAFYCDSTEARAELANKRIITLHSPPGGTIANAVYCKHKDGKCFAYYKDPSPIANGLAEGVGSPKTTFPICWKETHSRALRAFDDNPTVKAIKKAMQQSYFSGYRPSAISGPFIISGCLSKAANSILDFDGDCTSDLAVYRPGYTSSFEVLLSRTASFNSTSMPLGGYNDLPVPGDYDGDGKSDAAAYRIADGLWSIAPSSGAAPYSRAWGLEGDTPVPADYDGDGMTDIAVYRPSNGHWYVWPSGGGDRYAVPWGLSTDIPVPGDYDGDAKADFTIWRPGDGNWHVRPTSGAAPYAVQWGLQGDHPIPRDFDGDGRLDFAVRRDGQYGVYVMPSNGGSRYFVAFGNPDDIAVPADFDGDGKADQAVWQRAKAFWWYKRSTGGDRVPYDSNWGRSPPPNWEPVNPTIGRQWGTNRDFPLGSQLHGNFSWAGVFR